MSFKTYSDADDFASCYPFAAYQFSLVQKVFESIRKAGATGLHLSQGERSTLDAYRTNVDLHIVPRIGGVKLANLTTPRVQKFRDDLLANLSRVLAAKVLTALKSLLKHAMTTGHVAQNVASPVTITTTKRQKLKSRLRVGVDIPTPSEVTDIINAASDRWRPLIITAAFTGMRLSELRGLRWDHIDFEADVIHVRQRADKWGTIGPNCCARSPWTILSSS